MAEEQEQQMVTYADLHGEISERSDVDGIMSLPRVDAYKWFPRENRAECMVTLTNCGLMLGRILADPATPEEVKSTIEQVQNQIGSSMAPIIFQRGHTNPLNAKLVVFEMFDDDDEMRIYCVAKFEGQVDAETSRAIRYHLSKSQNTFCSQSMTLDLWLDQIAEEWEAVNEATNPAEVEREAVLEYLEGLKADSPLSDAIEDIREGLHLEEIEEDDEPEPGEEGEGEEGSEGEEEETDEDTAAAADGAAEPAAATAGE
jgi:hypothetical protein